MIGILFVLLLAIPIVELYVIVQAAQEIGILATLGLLIAISALGAWLLKQQGLATWNRVRETTARGEVPTKELTDGALILFGGALLLTPGFVTDAVGLVLLLPPTRATVKGGARRLLAGMAKRRAGVAWRVGGGVYETYTTSERRDSSVESDPNPEIVLDPPSETDDEDGSPGS